MLIWDNSLLNWDKVYSLSACHVKSNNSTSFFWVHLITDFCSPVHVGWISICSVCVWCVLTTLLLLVEDERISLCSIHVIFTTPLPFVRYREKSQWILLSQPWFFSAVNYSVPFYSLLSTCHLLMYILQLICFWINWTQNLVIMWSNQSCGLS